MHSSQAVHTPGRNKVRIFKSFDSNENDDHYGEHKIQDTSINVMEEAQNTSQDEFIATLNLNYLNKAQVKESLSKIKRRTPTKNKPNTPTKIELSQPTKK